MVTIENLREYLNLSEDGGDKIAELCLNAAVSMATNAGIPQFNSNAQYDLFIYALASNYYDNRGLQFVGSTGRANIEQSTRNLINSFVLQLRYATEDKLEDIDG